MSKKTDSYDIDIVVLWVDGNDPEWQKVYKKCRFGDEEYDFARRYRDWGIFKYWFRGIEKFMPWIRKIHFVTWGHLPSWLDTTNPKLHIVHHEDYIPSEYLPSFNSNVLEKFFHRIDDLAEHFIYFNDDLFVIKPVSQKDFFINGKPHDFLSFDPLYVYSNGIYCHTKLNDSVLLSHHFDKRDCIKKHRRNFFSFKYPLKVRLYNLVEFSFRHFTSFIYSHNPSPMLKSSYTELWEREGDALAESAKYQFRSYHDISQYVFRLWPLLKGDMVPCNARKSSFFCSLSNDNKNIFDIITHQKYKTICINDDQDDIDYETVKRGLISAFETILPDKCSYEKEFSGNE